MSFHLVDQAVVCTIVTMSIVRQRARFYSNGRGAPPRPPPPPPQVSPHGKWLIILAGLALGTTILSSMTAPAKKGMCAVVR
jgi:hypothetical protein